MSKGIDLILCFYVRLNATKRLQQAGVSAVHTQAKNNLPYFLLTDKAFMYYNRSI
jgi:hypothetical protein